MLTKLTRTTLMGCLLPIAFAVLSGCGGGGGSSSDGSTGSRASAHSVSSSSAASNANTRPVISGRPAAQITLGARYSFQPTATDADSDSLTFAINNKPQWATFNTLTGALTGMPGRAETDNNIVITVTDSAGASASLAAFSIDVSANGVTTGTATLSWIAPLLNTDGTPLLDLAGYVIYYGTDANNLDSTIDINSPLTLLYTVDGLASGVTYYFAVAAVNKSGAQSALSKVGSKTI